MARTMTARTIGGVNNRCETTDALNRPDCKPYGDALLSAYMNDAMISFWNAVVHALIQTGNRARLYC